MKFPGETGTRLGGLGRHVIDRAFDAFAWRARPTVVISSWHHPTGSKEAAEALLGKTAPHELDDTQFDVVFPDGTITISATPEGKLYYMPTVISRCIRDAESYNLAHDTLVQFRSRPYHLNLSIGAWPQLMDAAAGDKSALTVPGFAAEVAESGRRFLMGETRRWLMISAPQRGYGRTWADTLHLVSLMTPAERRALVAFFDYLATGDIWRGEPDIASANALLEGRGIMEVLLIDTAAECIEVAEALQALETRHPQDFPPQEVAPVKNLLLEIAAGRRSPDTRLGW